MKMYNQQLSLVILWIYKGVDNIDIDFDKVYKSKKCGDFKIISDCAKKNNSRHRYVQIQFINTGYVKESRIDHVLKGNVTDDTIPKVYGIGSFGNAGDYKESRRLYSVWHGMLRRCYSQSYNEHKNYGGIGVRVCDEWLFFANFLHDAKLLPNYDKYELNPDAYQLDKDYLQQGIPNSKKVYSKDTCMWLPRHDNLAISRNNSQYGIGVSKTGDYFRADIKINGNNMYIGTFDSKIAAQNAYNLYYNMYANKGSIQAINQCEYMDEVEILKHNRNPKIMCKIVDPYK